MKEKYEKYLPIGSVVLLENAIKKVMITGYSVVNEADDKVYDYLGCLWPEGVLSTDRNILFDHNNIEKIFAIGYSNEETETYMNLMKRAIELREKELEKESLELSAELDNDNSASISDEDNKEEA